MITVVGVNTAVDRSMRCDVVRPGGVMRVHDVQAVPGCKGVHVALACAALGVPVRLVGLMDRAHRARFQDWLGAQGVELCPLEIEGEIRTCLAIHGADGAVTEFLEPGPCLDEAAASRLASRLLAEIGEHDGAQPIVLTGSLPRGLPRQFYATMVAGCRSANRPCLVDASGEPLRAGLAARPTLVSPNREEAEMLSGVALTDLSVAGRVARWIVEHGADVAVISLAADGVVASDGRSVWHVFAPPQPVANPVGAGDSLMGALAVGVARRLPAEALLVQGVACAAAAVRHPAAGMVEPDEIERLRPLISVRCLNIGGEGARPHDEPIGG